MYPICPLRIKNNVSNHYLLSGWHLYDHYVSPIADCSTEDGAEPSQWLKPAQFYLVKCSI